jgi:hypothetical protein
LVFLAVHGYGSRRPPVCGRFPVHSRVRWFWGRPWSRRTRVGHRIALPMSPARLAVGLVLGSGLVGGYPPSFAPPCVFRLRVVGSPAPPFWKEWQLRLQPHSRMR